MNDLLSIAAERLAQQRLSRGPIDLELSERPLSERDGYALQRLTNARLSSLGLGSLAGFKIGCTTPVMQRFLGIGSPCAGEVFATTILHERGTVRAADYRKLGVECEIVAFLSAAIEPSGAPFTAASVASHVGAIAAGIEIVDDRYRDFRTLGVHSLIADNFFNAGCVLGKPVADWSPASLPQRSGRMLINAEEVGRGTGEMVLGHPLEALAWLANLRASLGLGLSSGAFVFLGSLVETKWLKPGDHVRIEIDDLGPVELTVI